MSQAERLMMLMLTEIHEATVTSGQVDPRFLRKAILNGHLWAIDWEYSGAGFDHTTDVAVVTQVNDILDMFTFMEEAVERMSPEEVETLDAWRTKFAGFDGNGETDHMSVARFLVDDMGRWSRFKGRDFNSHSPNVTRYLRMVRAFEPIRKMIGTRAAIGMTRDEVAAVIDAGGSTG